MPTEVKLPELGENIEAGDVVTVLVKPGDKIEADQPLLELETDKATIEVPSPVGGTVQQIQVKVGDKVKVGQVILTVDDGAKGASDKSAPAKQRGRTRASGDLASDGGMEQDTGSAEAPAGPAGKAEARQDRKQGKGEKEEARAQKPSARDVEVEEADEPEAGEAAAADTDAAAAPDESPAPVARRGEVVDIRGARPAQGPEAVPSGPAAPAAPSVRRLARELGVDINRVPGAGPEGRISMDDVKAYARLLISSGGAARPGAGPAIQPLPDFSKWGDIERKPMSNIRRKTSEHLSYAWRTIPHVVQYDQADITDLDRLRKRYEKLVADGGGGKLTVTAVAVKVLASALRQFPQFNSSLDAASNEIIYKKYVHIGVAVDTDRGLLVPVIRDADKKNLIQLSGEINAAAEKARARKLTLEEMEGGSFTISNLGGIGGTHFAPIVNAPEVAILGVSRGSLKPVYIDGNLQPRQMLPLSLSYDHRVIDGADAIRFLRWVVEALEQPFVLSLQG